MKVIMRIPLKLSDSLITNLDRQTAEYESMVNGLIQGKHLIVHCDDRTATELLSWADDRIPGANQSIEVVKDL